MKPLTKEQSEHTAPDEVETIEERRWVPEEKLAAANARVAELEQMNALDAKRWEAELSEARAQRDQAREMAGECSEKELAANARADAAERCKDTWVRESKRACASLSDRLHRAESEAAALRAEVEQQKSAYDLRLAAWESDRLALMSRLSTATELVRRVRRPVNCHDDPSDDIDDFLSTAPAPTEREAAERKVLLSCERAEIVAACNHGIQCCAKFDDARYIVQAELARRAVKS